MKQFSLLFLTVITGLLYSCCDGDDDGPTVIPPGDKSIELSVTGRVGAVLDDDLTNYVQSLQLLTFRKNVQGGYVLYQTRALTLADLQASGNGSGQTLPGFTTARSLTVSQLPLGTYEIVGLANVLDNAGNALPGVSLSGVVVGNTMEQVIASVTDGTEAPNFFYGVTLPVVLGEAAADVPTLTLSRKVSMFMLTLKDIPQVVTKITLETRNTYGSFDMTGQFLVSPVIGVKDSVSYDFATAQDSVIMTSVSLPTAGGTPSSFTVTFTLGNGQVIPLTLPQYILKENTITKVTATINTEKPGDEWRLDLVFDITVNVEWNVDQEPPVEI